MYKFAQCILAVVIMGMPAMAFGQSEMGQLAGRITDNSGQPLPGANIVLEDNERGTAADAFGRYNFRDLKPGNYNVLVTYVGFKSSTFLVEVKSGVLTRLDAKLHDDAAVIGEIVIQNEKFIRNLQETQTSVNVVSAEEIEALAIRDWREAGRIIGNFQNDAFGGFTIRGISINGVGFGGQGQTAQFYIDGVAQSSIGTRFGSRGVWDAEAFEVFRGPQSTVSGRNALIGSVALRSKDPEFSWGGAARLTGGNQENREVAVAFTGPLIADQLAFRISGEYQFLDTGFRYPRLDALNLGGSDDLVRSEYANVKARLLFTPKGVPELSARLSYSFANDRPTLLLQATGPDFEARESFAPYATLEDGTVHNAALELGYGLTEAITLTSVSAFHSGGRDRDGLRFIDPDPTLIIPVGSKGDLINSDFTQELRLNYETDRTQAVIGGYFGHFDSDSENRNLGDIFPIVEGLIAEAVGGPVPPAEILYDAYTDFETVVDNIAVFGEVNQEVTEALKVTVGLRYDNENFTQSSESVADVSADPQAFGMFTPIILGVLRAQIQEPPTNPETTYSAFLPKVGLAYDVTSDLTVGATVQRGYRSGGAQILVNGELNVFDPEYTWNYEVSLRSRWLNGRLTANVNAFYMDWTDQQLSVPIEGTTLVRTANAGASTLYGFEMELRAIPVLGLTLFSSLGIVETEFDEFILNGVDLSGFSFPSSAGESYSIGFLYRPGNGLANGFFATADVSHTGSYFSAVGTGSDGQNDPDLKAGDYTVVNARVGYEYGFRGRMLGVSLFARNLFDEPVELQAVTGGFGGRVVQFGLPAVYGVTLDVDF